VRGLAASCEEYWQGCSCAQQQAGEWCRCAGKGLVRSLSSSLITVAPSDDLVAQRGVSTPQPIKIVLQDIQHVLLVFSRLPGSVRRDQDVREIP